MKKILSCILVIAAVLTMSAVTFTAYAGGIAEGHLHTFAVTNPNTGKSKCTVCGFTAGAVINKKVGYTTFAEAYDAAVDGDLITLFANAVLESTALIDKAVTIDLAGKTAKCSSGTVFETCSNVVIRDSVGTGKVTGNGNSTAVRVQSGSLEIYGGTYNGAGTCAAAVGANCWLWVFGGTFRSTAKSGETGTVFNFPKSANARFSGGVIYGQNISPYLAPCHKLTVEKTEPCLVYTVVEAHGDTAVFFSEPTCTEKGLRVVNCSVCGAELERTVIPAKGHAFGDWEEEAGTGLMSRSCATCGTAEYKSAPPTVRLAELKVTIGNLARAKDFFIARGTYNDFESAKENHFYRATSGKFAATGSFTYTLPESGKYTLAVRYTDGTPATTVCFKAEITACAASALISS